jgi:cyclopropane fatty-acyl-phospholipid synthase-like methyltransferase
MVASYMTPEPDSDAPPPEVLEIGSGKGKVLLDLLHRHPGANVTGELFGEHSVAFRERSVPFREHYVEFREHSVARSA